MVQMEGVALGFKQFEILFLFLTHVCSRKLYIMKMHNYVVFREFGFTFALHLSSDSVCKV